MNLGLAEFRSDCLDNFIKSAMLLRVIAANGRCIQMEGGINQERVIFRIFHKIRGEKEFDLVI